MSTLARPPTLPSAAATRVRPPTPDPLLPRFSLGAAVAGVLAASPLLGIGVLAAIEGLDSVRDETVTAVMGLTTFTALIGFAWAIVTVVRLGRTPLETRAHGRWLAALAIPVSVVTGALGALVTLLSTISFSRGRQLRERGRPVFAPLVDATEDDGEGWLVGAGTLSSGDGCAVEIADAWREAGKTEHASVGAFAQLAARLVSLGAPARLIEDAHRDAVDEIRHARLCFSLARDIDGRSLEPGALPGLGAAGNGAPLAARVSRTTSLAHLAVQALIDGALNEGTSARAVAKLARRVTNARVRDVLLAIARDEGRHAAHGWHVLEWCLREGGEPVRSAVRASLRVLPTQMGASLVAAGDDGRWEAWGIPSRAVTEESYAEVRAALVARATLLVAARPVTREDAHAAA